MRWFGHNAKLMAVDPAYGRKIMKQYLLLTSALVLLNGTAEAACIQTPSCSSLGYSSTTACEGGLKCPWGNAWFCNVGGGGSSTPDYSNCKIGDILYSDMTCNTNMIASKTPIGVVFDVTNTLAIAKDEFTNLSWGMSGDISGIQNYANSTTSVADWQGFKNTKAIYDYEKSLNSYYPSMEKVLLYSTTGTSQGQWYLPAAGELKAISDNKDALNTTLSKIGGTQMSGAYWSSSEQDNSNVWLISLGRNPTNTKKDSRSKAKPIINFASKDKINVDLNKSTACKIGDILYSDKTCSASVVSGKTPIGVVFDGTNRLAIALTSKQVEWGVFGDLQEFPNDQTENEIKKNYTGKNNTLILVEKGANKYPAAQYAYTYETIGTNAGDWYLASMGELNEIYQNKTILNNRLKTLGNSPIPSDHLWSSNEYIDTNAWCLDFTNGENEWSYRKYNALYVLPVLAF